MAQSQRALFCLLSLSLCALSAAAPPTIGVVTVPIDEEPCGTVFRALQRKGGLTDVPADSSCFNAYYVKWLESSGLRVAVIPYNSPDEELAAFVDSLNGLLFTGGGLGLHKNTTYYQTTNKLFHMVKAKNDKGTHLPLWGTCMGFQLLHILAADDEGVLELEAFDSEDLSLPLDFTPAAAGSRFISNAPNAIKDVLAKHNATVNLHHDGVPPSSYTKYPKLADFFTMISTNKDRKGKEFVSTAESKHYPIYATQWHPERPQFEWASEDNINHDAPTIEAMQWAGRFLAFEVRRNTQSFSNATLERASLIYSHLPLPDPDATSKQYYLFQAF